MTLAARVLGPTRGRRDLTYIDDDGTARELLPVGRTYGLFILAAGLIALLATVLVLLVGTSGLPGYHPLAVANCAAFGVVGGIVFLRVGDRLPWGAFVGALFTTGAVCALGTYYSGPSFSAYAASFFVWLVLAATLFGDRSVAIVFVLFVALAEAIVLSIQHPSPAPAARWLLTVGVCAVTAFVFDLGMSLLTTAIQNERAAKTALQEVSRHKSEFLASMSHELRTPMNAIIGFSDVLAGQHFGELNERQLEYVGDVQDAGRHLLSLINDVLDLAKIESGSMEIDARTFPLTEAISAAVNFIAPRASENRIEVSADIAPDAHEAFGDDRRIRQVLINLLSNAVKFTPAGGRISVIATASQSATSVAVTDSGVGIAAADLERIFEDFQQVGDVHQATEGTGLGLALCRQLVELHGGSIRVESTPGEGSTFTFEIPRVVDSTTA